MTTTIGNVRPDAATLRGRLAGTWRVLPRTDTPPYGWCLHMFGATTTAERAAACLGALLRTELDHQGTLNPTRAIDVGGHHTTGRTRGSAFDTRLQALVDAVIDPARTDTQNRVALLLCRYTPHLASHADDVAVWVVAPADLPPFEEIAAFAHELVHDTPVTNRFPHFVFAVDELSPPACRRTPPPTGNGRGAWPRRMGASRTIHGPSPDRPHTRPPVIAAPK